MDGAFRAGAVLLGKYRVESVVGRGGMGIVLRVMHLQLGEHVAIKVMVPEPASTPASTARFIREAQSVVRLRGEHVTRVIDVGMLPETGTPYIVMEYLRGVDLASELARRRALPPGEAVDYVLQACEAMGEAHANGIVHRDIKPANLFLTTRPDGTPLVKVLDFGVSKSPVTAGVVTRTDTVVGTPGYMSPEQIKASKDVDARTDVWGLGIILYECLNGRRPWDAEAYSAIILKAATEPPLPMERSVPRGLQSVVLRCLEKDRNARFPSVAALAAALAPFARDQRAASLTVDRTQLMARGVSQGLDSPAPPPPPSPTATTLSGSVGVARARTQRRFLVGAISLVGVIAMISIAAVVFWGHSDLGSHPPDRRVALPDAAMLDEAVVIESPDDASVAIDENAVWAKCTDLYIKKEWQGLTDCATELERLGLADKAKEFHDQAVRETQNEASASKVRQALKDGNLKEAQATLRSIDEDSVYARPSREAFTRAETQAVDDARRKAQLFVAQHDCQSHKRLYVQAAVGSTERVAAAVGAFMCTPVAAAAEPAARTSPCDTMNVEEVMAQATAQYSAGYAKAALALMVKALACKQDARMYRLAVTYACAAHELGIARMYFSKVPAAYQANLDQKCQLEGVIVSPP